MRVLHAPTNIANQAWGAVSGLRELGIEARLWHHMPNPFSFPADREIDHGGDPQRIFESFLEALSEEFDVFHFHFARSLMPATQGIPLFWDLPILRALGKKVFFTFHGTDVRLRSVHLEEDPWSYFRFADVKCDEQLIARRMAVIRTFANKTIVAGAPLLTFVPDAAYVPKIVDTNALRMVGAKRESRPVVVHVPSRRATKGTEFVLKGIEELRADAQLDFEFVFAESLSHDQLVELLADADIVVDNLLIGDCEVTSLEAMALGKAVVTRIRTDVREAHPDLPVIDANPDTFTERLRPLLRDAGLRRSAGEQGRAFVESTHAPTVIAKQLVDLYQVETKPVYRSHPDWVATGLDRKVERLEQRITEQTARMADLNRKIETRDRKIASLEEQLEQARDSLASRMEQKARRVLGKAKKR